MIGFAFKTTDRESLSSWFGFDFHSRTYNALPPTGEQISVLYVDAGTKSDPTADGRSLESEFAHGRHVDMLGGAKRLREEIGTADLDYVLGKRALEYVPDVIGWLSDLRRVCSANTVIGFYVSDARFGTNARVNPSSMGSIVEAWIEKKTKPSIRHVFDSCLERSSAATHDDSKIDHDRLRGADLSRAAEALSLAKQSAAVGASGGDCWAFSPSSLLSILEGACRLGLFPFKVDELIVSDVQGGHFFIALRPEIDEKVSINSIRTAMSRLSDDPHEVLYRESEDDDRIQMRQWFEMACARQERLRSEVSRGDELRQALDEALEKNERLTFELRRRTRA